MSKNVSKKLDYFRRYLEIDLAATRPNPREKQKMLGCLGLLVLYVGLGFFALPLLQLQVGFNVLAHFMLVIGLGSIAGGMEARLSKPQNEEEKSLANVHAVLREFDELTEPNRLHKMIDVTAGQLLEACAYYWHRVHSRLSEPVWVKPELSIHFKTVREETIFAVNDGMREASRLAVRCIAPKGSRKNRTKEIWEDLTDLDLDAVLDGFRQTIRENREGYRSDQLTLVYEPLRDIAERLKSISEEIDKSTVAMDQTFPETRETPKMALDSALQSLRDLQAAQKEAQDEFDSELRH